MADLSDDILFESITGLNTRLRKKEFTAVELTRTFARRLEQVGPRLNALALPLTEVALRNAKEIDGELKRDRLRGPLQGIPYGAKDLLAYAGHPTTWGAKPFAAQVFNENAAVIDKLNASGSVLIGKLAMVELAGGGGYRFPNASLFGAGLNPWDRSRWAGGSSSGSASAVAAGLVPFAIGSETNGSILFPAAYCGVTGLRPTYGLVSRRGAMALAWTMDKIGPLCRTAEDCGIVLQAIAGGDSRDPGSSGKSFYYAPQFSRQFKDLKLGFAPSDLDLAEPALRPVFETALDVIRGLGMAPVETRLPDLPYSALTTTVISSEAACIFESLITSGQVNQLVDVKQVEGLKAGLEIPARDYLRAMRVRSLLKAKLRELFADIDVIVAPTRYVIAPKVSEALAPSNAEGGMSALIPAGNLAGLPAISMPCGFANGMPLALQIVGPPYSENTLLAVAREFQSRTDWHKQRPKV